MSLVNEEPNLKNVIFLPICIKNTSVNGFVAPVNNVVR